MKNTFPFYTVWQILKIRFKNIYKTQPPVLLFLIFTLVFTSADISFYNFLELLSTMVEIFTLTLHLAHKQSKSNIGNWN